MPSTIDKLDIGAYVQYAKRTEQTGETIAQLGLRRLEQASGFPALIQVQNMTPQQSEMSLLLGLTSMHTPWAYFAPPKRFNAQRKSVFGFARIVSSVGSHSDEEEEERESFLDTIECETDEEKQEKAVIKECMTQVKKINGWLAFIIGRIGQFIQG